MNVLGLLAFVLGPAVALAIAPMAWVGVVLLRPPAAVRRAADGAAVVAVVTFIAYWYLWGQAFEASDAFRPVPRWVDTGMLVSAAGCALACAALLVLVVVAAARAVARRGGTRAGVTPAGDLPGTSA